MHIAARLLTILGAFTALSSASAQQAVIDGLPAGVIVYDQGAAPSATQPLVLDAVVSEPSALFAPVINVAPLTTQSPASVRSPAAVPVGTVLDPSIIAPQIDLAPGETVLQVVAVPAIVKVPAAQPIPAYVINAPSPISVPRAVPEPKVDPVTGKLRDTAGWTGESASPASIGCFPAGACSVLNQR